VPCYAFNARHASRHLTQFYDQMLVPSGIRITQFTMLMALSKLGPLTIVDLAKGLEMDRTTLGRNLGPLERDGIIEMSISATDGRKKLASLTTLGKRKLDRALALWRNAQVDFESRFGIARASALREELRAAVSVLETAALINNKKSQ